MLLKEKKTENALRIKALSDEGKTYSEIAEILSNEGFVNKNGVRLTGNNISVFMLKRRFRTRATSKKQDWTSVAAKRESKPVNWDKVWASVEFLAKTDKLSNEIKKKSILAALEE